jgi:ABC-2 type transport system permease protein
MMLPIIFAVPIFQLLILSYTATFEIKKIDLGIVDLDRSISSADLISRFSSSPFYILQIIKGDYPELETMMQAGDLEQIIYIPHDFEKSLLEKRNTSVQIITDAVNGSAASLMSAYSMNIIGKYNKDFLVKEVLFPRGYKQINSQVAFWYNPDLNYKTFMVPGILVLLVTIIGLFLSAMNIVREKEIGTIEQLNVTPIKKYQFIIGKLAPFWFIAMFDLVIGLLLARFVFAVPMLGSIPLVIGVASIYLVLILGMGLFISTLSNTQQQSMFISWFFVMIFILLSGLFTPIENMPPWAQMLNILNPIAYFIEFMRLVLLKGSSFADVAHLVYSISIYAILMIGLATWKYRKVS